MKLKSAPWLAIGASLALSAAQPAGAGPEDCRAAIDDYDEALRDVASALRSYSSCVSGSRGKDDCSLEFLRVRSAQSDFEDAVQHVRRDCRD
jgi:hypothetical protein